jgi:soluble lytic murein transglycosylase-like protein
MGQRIARTVFVASLLISWVTTPTLTARVPIGRTYDSLTWHHARAYAIPPRMAELVIRAAERHRIPLATAFRLVRHESAFQIRVVSDSGAVGLAQVKPSTARGECPGGTDLYHPRQNLDCGFSYLRRLLGRYGGEWEYALAAYNRGPGVADTLLRPDTLRYVRRVLGLRIRPQYTTNDTIAAENQAPLNRKRSDALSSPDSATSTPAARAKMAAGLTPPR